MAILIVAGCSGGSDDGKKDSAACFQKSESEVQLVAHGDDFGGWRMFAAHDWKGLPYAVSVRAAWAESGCGFLGAGAVPTSGGGGIEYHGKSLSYVYGAVSDPVKRVRVTYGSGQVQEIEPVSVEGFDIRFFADVREATGGFQVVGLDAAGNPVPEANT